MEEQTIISIIAISVTGVIAILGLLLNYNINRSESIFIESSCKCYI